MALGHQIIQKQTQKLIITQDLRQSIELLPLNNVELRDRIEQELVENPMLEEDVSASLPAESKLQEKEGDDASSYREESWKETHDSSFSRNSEKSESKHQYLQNAVKSHESLQDHLLWQLRLLDITSEDLETGQLILSAMDNRGFLTISLEELTGDTDVSIEQARKVLSHIQKLDPIGCGAANVQESLIIQSRILRPGDRDLQKILSHYFDSLEKLDFNSLQKKINISQERLEEILRFIRTLEPYPGTLFAPEEAEYIIPDVYVRKGDEGFNVVINDDWLPSLSINEEYSSLIKEGVSQSESDREYMQNKLTQARWLIKSIGQRRLTLLRVTQAIVEFQEEFFNKGSGYLRPLTLKDVAEKVNLHESTISRITSHKYVQTPHGLFDLKYFFSSSLQSDSGEGESSRNIQEKIRQIVVGEDLEHPYSDQQIADLIGKEGVKIARRTVAKYRKILQILPADRRKRLGKINSKLS